MPIKSQPTLVLQTSVGVTCRSTCTAGEFSHQGPLCTYEVLAQRFGLTASPAVERIGRIVHDLDMHDTRYGCPEAPAVSRMVEGLRQLHADDHALLQHGVEMFEALARGILAGSMIFRVCLVWVLVATARSALAASYRPP